jgi:UDP-3-O-[3-hydroxymyristoyl] glucosamine N-acyltransferase
MKIDPISVKTIAEKIAATDIIGNTDLILTGINEIHKVQKGDLTFVDVKKYFDKSIHSAASCIIINEIVDCPEGKTLIIHPQPFDAYNNLVWEYRPYAPLIQNRSATAEIHPTAIIEPNVVIGHYVTIGRHCHIGANTVIADYTTIKDNVTIMPGSIIGTDAFYFKKWPEGYESWRSCGTTIIEKDVFIGPGCTINKGVSGDTIIGEGTKLDAQVHIAHGVVVGKRCLFAAQVGIAGKTIIGDDVTLYGQVGVAQNLTIGDKAIVLAKSGVSKSLEGHKTYFGYPAQEVKEAYKDLASLRMLRKKPPQ